MEKTCKEAPAKEFAIKRICSALFALILCLSLSAPAFSVENQTIHATIRSPNIIIEGERAGFLSSPQGMCEPITYNGSVYIPLMTVGLWLGADAFYDQNAKTVTVVRNNAEPVYYSLIDLDRMGVERLEGVEQYQEDMRNGVDVQPLPDVTVTLDNQVVGLVNALGESVYPLLFRESVFLPVRSVAGWMGKQVQWLGNSSFGTVYIYTTPTQEELDESNIYVATIRGHLNAVRTLLEKTYVVHSDGEFFANIRKIQADLQAIRDLPEPAFQSLKSHTKYLRLSVLNVLCENVDPWLPAEESSGAAEELGLTQERFSEQLQESIPETKWMRVRGQFISVAENMTTTFLVLEKSCTSCETFLTMVNAHPDQPTV